MTDEEIKVECEKHFQNGMQRTIIVGSAGYACSGQDSVKAAQNRVVEGERIFTRAKVRNERRYEWKEIK